MKYVHERQINGYVPDNRFRSREPKFQNQKDKYGKQALTDRGQREAENGKIGVHFEGGLLQWRHCPKKHQCMQNPALAHHRKGLGRQVSFTIENKRLPNYTGWQEEGAGPVAAILSGAQY